MQKIIKANPEKQQTFERLSGRSHGAGSYVGEGSRSGADVDVCDKAEDGAGDINDDGDYEQTNGSFTTVYANLKGVGNGILDGSSYGGGLGEQQPMLPKLEKSKDISNNVKIVVLVVMTIVFIQALLMIFQERGLI